jgi:hypothetical protein
MQAIEKEERKRREQQHTVAKTIYGLRVNLPGKISKYINKNFKIKLPLYSTTF